MSLSGYLLGAAALAVVIGGWAVAAQTVRGLLLPGLTGATARLAEVVLGLAGLTVLLQILGLAGALGAPGLVLGSLAAPAAAIAARRRLAAPQPDESSGEIPPEPRWAVALAAAAVLFVAALWIVAAQQSWTLGLGGFDTLWYHAPFAARFAETGSIWSLHFTDPDYLNWFYPQNSELLHAAGISLFDRDVLSPLLNLGWLAVALLAAWCIGRTRGVGFASLVGVCAVLVTGAMIPREAGTAANDIAAAALLLASAAFVLEGDRRAGRGRWSSRHSPPGWRWAPS